MNEAVWIIGTGLTEAEYREALRCQNCGHDTYNDPWIEGSCRFGNCVEFSCRECGVIHGSFGPVGCGCQRRIHSARQRRISANLRRVHRRAARR